MKKYSLNISPDFWKENPVSIGNLKVYLIWFDSMGAKSSCILIKTPEIKILIDPGVAAMQPGYPLPDEEKSKLRNTALECIREASKEADTIFISHYHYDHHTLPREAGKIYEGKTLWIKNPNIWINQSQWKRARIFLEGLIGNKSQIIYTSNFSSFSIQNSLLNLPIAQGKNYGSYQKRKNEIIKKGKDWLKKLQEKWNQGPRVDEENLKKHKIFFADGKEFQAGATRVRFTLPLFHGMEYDRLGWVIGIVIERVKTKLIYTSDLQGPIIEDYARWIAKEKPSILLLDGPATYLLGYMLNTINLQRCINNLLYILDNTSPKIFILDHHLLRDQRYRDRISRVYAHALRKGKKILTAAEWYKETPLILKITGKMK